MNQTLLKVLPRRDYLFKRHVAVHVVGNGFSCSPVNGIAVFIQPSCVDQGNCPGVLPCVSLKDIHMSDLIRCEFRCHMKEPWDYALLDFAAYNARVDVTVDWQFC